MNPNPAYSGAERRRQNLGYTPERRRAQSTKRDANRDPITGTPGAHPVGVGLGAAAGGMATGAAVGTVAGPVGTAVGAAVGAIAGGLAGKGIAEKVDPTVEETYWARQYQDEPYYDERYEFQDYHPAYRTGWEGRSKYGGRTYEEVERDLQADYERNRGKSRLDWESNRHAVRAGWDRLED
jgi:hypothetical protein